jgi:hypothetical protein
MAAGIDTVAMLRERHADRLKNYKQFSGKRGVLQTYTRNVPKREDELTDGGSIYWVLRTHVRVRQRILAITRETDDEGRGYCLIRLDPELVLVEPRHHKAFQGWRYLRPEDAPPDLGSNTTDVEEMPSEMADELRALGLI